MADFDYAAWVARAQAFTERLAHRDGAEIHSSTVHPPIQESDLGTVERTLGRTLPSSLRAFFTRGADGLDCQYAYEPDDHALDRLREVMPHEIRIYGGARLGPASALPDMAQSVGEWAEDTWVAESTDQQVIWKSALPFAGMDNGDYLALDLRADATDPPVVYLNHDDESSVIAPDFVTFLNTWERLCYLGPEHWMLLEFAAADGHLDPDSARAAQLRQLLAP